MSKSFCFFAEQGHDSEWIICQVARVFSGRWVSATINEGTRHHPKERRVSAQIRNDGKSNTTVFLGDERVGVSMIAGLRLSSANDSAEKFIARAREDRPTIETIVLKQ